MLDNYVDSFIELNDLRSEISDLLLNNGFSSQIKFVLCLSVKFLKSDIEGIIKFQNFCTF